MPFITVLQNTENTRAGGEFKGLFLESTVCYEIFAVDFQFIFERCIFAVSKTD